MRLQGCGNHGFSYTEKYKKSIVAIFDWVNGQDSQELDYLKFQEKISSLGVSKPSEVRMIIPFLVKAGVINDLNIIRGKSRIRSIHIDDNFFTENGKIFVQVLKIILLAFKTGDNTVMRQVLVMYHKIGKIQFAELRNSEEAIYQDLYNFLKKYTHINRDEFFILTSCRARDKIDDLPNYIAHYREGKIKKIEYVSNINCYQYIIGTLEDLGVIIKTNDGYILSTSIE